MRQNLMYRVKPGPHRYRRFSKNEKGRDLVVGDIHGRFDLLSTLLEDIRFNPEKDRLFGVGDLVDRGVYSSEVMSWLDEDWFFSVLGNHEQMNLGADVDNEDAFGSRHCISEGGDWLFDIDNAQAKAIQAVFAEMPVAIEVEGKHGERFGIVHAEPVSRDWNKVIKIVTSEKGSEVKYDWFREKMTAIDEMLWNRAFFKAKYSSMVKNVDKVFVGHNKLLDTLTLGNVHYIDTGAYTEWGRLTVVDMNTGDIFQCR